MCCYEWVGLGAVEANLLFRRCSAKICICLSSDWGASFSWVLFLVFSVFFLGFPSWLVRSGLAMLAVLAVLAVLAALLAALAVLAVLAAHAAGGAGRAHGWRCWWCCQRWW
jgi:hypothetical protein